MENTKPQVLNKYDQLLLQFDPESMRGKAVLAVRNFRSSWIDLGRYLMNIAYGGDYKDWGYEDFEVYCARELGLKKPTVQKLMVSYQYIKGREPELLKSVESGEEKTLPDYTTVDQLAKAERCADVDQEHLKDVHAQVFNGEMSDAEAKRAIKDARSDTEPALPDMDRTQCLNDIRRTAKALIKKLSESKKFIPQGTRERTETILSELVTTV